MKIIESIYLQILDCPDVPPECGGLLGAENGEVVNHVVFDSGLQSSETGIYIPNIPFLNDILREWGEHGIEFKGIFHTHAVQWPVLSKDDKVYINEILNAMPTSIQFLYFPLVFSKRNIKGYCARRTGITIDIIDDNITIIKQEERSNERNK